MNIVCLPPVPMNYKSVESNTGLSLCLSKALPMSLLIVLTFSMVSPLVGNNPPAFLVLLMEGTSSTDNTGW
jgi:hypothetical protein